MPLASRCSCTTDVNPVVGLNLDDREHHPTMDKHDNSEKRCSQRGYEWLESYLNIIDVNFNLLELAKEFDVMSKLTVH